MTENRETLEAMFADGTIRVLRSGIFDESPAPHRRFPDWDRVEGMLLGLAIGDALGALTEGLRPRIRRRIFGEICNYLANPHTGERKGYPTDDTQLAFWTLEQMLADGRFMPENVARCFSSRPIFGMGKTVSEFRRRHREERRPWCECGPASAGNGALMRIAPMIVPHLGSGTSELWVDTALSAMITHNDPASTASCVGFVRILWELLGRDRPPPRDWWRSTFVETAAPLEGDTKYRPHGGRFRNYEGPMWQYVADRLGHAARRRLSVRDACDEWWSSAYLMETLPCVLHILSLHADNPKQAIVRAVNDTMDNDTIAAIVGAAVGALHGKTGLPRRWIAALTGRTQRDDDGRIPSLLDAARQRWGR